MHPPAPGHADVHRVVRRDGVEIVAGREAPFRELVGAADVIELRGAEGHEHRPLAWRGLLDPEAHPFDDVLHRVTPGERKAATGLQPLAVHVGVRVVEAGAHRPAFEVDDARRVAAAGKHLGGGAERGDGTRGDSDRLRGPRCGVEGEDVAVVQDQIVLAHGGWPWEGRAPTISAGRGGERPRAAIRVARTPCESGRRTGCPSVRGGGSGGRCVFAAVDARSAVASRLSLGIRSRLAANFQPWTENRHHE